LNIFKKWLKMNRLEKAILKALLSEKEASIYKLNKILKEANYPTVWRYVKRMEKDGLIKISEKPDKRETKLISITSKGIATLLIEGDLTKEELEKSSNLFWSKMDWISKLPQTERLLTLKFLAEVWADSLLNLRPKINLKYFDEEWFGKIWLEETLKALKKNEEKYRKTFEELGVWATEEERKKSLEEIIKLFEDLDNLIKRLLA